MRNIIYVSLLCKEGYCFEIVETGCSISRNDIYYGNCKTVNGLYLLDNIITVCNILNPNNKRIKTDKKTTYLWHCRLGHINERRIKKMHTHGCLGQFDLKSIGTCESCLSGKMIKALFSRIGERANVLLGIIHSDVCGLMSICVRGGHKSQYFITFTDDMYT